MVTYRPMDESCLLASCLHGGPISLAVCREAATAPAYVETICDLPAGTIVGALARISRRYGACGMMAVEDALVVGKIRFSPHALVDMCVQQEQQARLLADVDIEGLPSREASPILRLDCIQVAAGYRGRGIAGEMLDHVLDWAQSKGWREVRSSAIRYIPPLLEWSGCFSHDALERRGFVVTSQRLEPALREGVVSQRQGDHGAEVQAHWNAFAAMSDDEAATMYEMTLRL